MEHGPILIGGIGRTGKTMMRFLLSSHPNIACSRRTNMWTQIYCRYGDLSRDENLARCMAAMLTSKHIARLGPDPVRIHQEFREGPATYARLFALFHAHYAAQEGKGRWGDQTELIEQHTDAIMAAYPNARMIHMIRDPRDCCAASAARRSNRIGNTGEVVAMWRHSALLATRNQSRYPHRYRVVRYETLVIQPAATIQAICAFIQEPYIPAILLLEEIPRYRGVAKAIGRSPITDEYIGSFRTTLPAREIAFIQAAAGPTLAAYGYTPESIILNRRERLALFGRDGPLYLTRMLFWRLRRARRARLPAWPSHRMHTGDDERKPARVAKPHATS